MPDERLAARLKDLRVARGLTVADVAKVCGKHSTNISHLEANRQGPTIDMLRALAALYGCSIDALLDVDAPLPEPTAEAPAEAKA